MMRLAEFFRWLVGKTGLYSIAALLLMLVGLTSMSFVLSDLVEGLNGSFLGVIILVGLVTGWLLARSRWKGWQASLAAALLGAGWLLLQIGQLARPLAVIIQQAWEYVPAFLKWHWRVDPIPDAKTLLLAWGDLQGVAGALSSRFSVWFDGLTHGIPNADPLISSLLWYLLAWSLAIWAAWATRRRHQPVAALAPAAILLAACVNYVSESVLLLMPLMACLLLLQVLSGHFVRERQWEAQGIDYSSEVRADLGIVSVSLTAVLLIAAVVTPSISIKQAIETARSLTEKPAQQVRDISRSLGLQPKPEERKPSKPQPGRDLPTVHLLGSGPDLSEKVVMYISTGEVPPGPPDLVSQYKLPHYYWRSVTFDSYNGQGWVNSPAYETQLKSGEPAFSSAQERYRVVQQSVNWTEKSNTLLYAAGEPVTADRDFKVRWRVDTVKPAGLFGRGDLLGITLPPGDYKVRSLVAEVSEQQLRSEGEGFVPIWVSLRYMELPATVPQRVLDLAAQITSEKTTRYDRAIAIESYLRDTYTYTLDVPIPPEDRDVADYFLFDLKRGYCDYYATAMAVMARAVGLPARLAVGYATGSYDTYRARYEVTEADAHAWVEIYFPGTGWVEFEPTSARESIVRPATSSDIKPPSTSPAWDMRQHNLVPLQWLAGTLLFLAVIGGIIWQGVDLWRLKRAPPGATAIMLYRRMRRSSQRVAPPRKGDTPFEYGRSLLLRLRELAGRWLFRRSMTQGQKEAQTLTDLYARAVYSARSPSKSEQVDAIEKWKRLRWRLWVARWFK